MTVRSNVHSIGLEDSSGTRGVVHFVHDAFGSLYVSCGWFRASMQEQSPTKELCTDALKVMRTGSSHRT